MLSIKDLMPVAGSKSRPLVIAHRGASGLAPENTLAAFSLAAALGADGIEFDVQLSADGKVVVIHDRRLDRTTSGRGSVSAMTFDEIRHLDAGSWFDRKLALRPRIREMVHVVRQVLPDQQSSAGHRVPSLEQTFELLAPLHLRRIYVELKPGRMERLRLLEAVIGLVRQAGLSDSVTLLSFDHGIIAQAGRLAPDIRRAATYAPMKGGLGALRPILESALETGVSEAALHYGLASRRLVDGLHERGISVSAWTANRKIIFRRLISSGVDSIMTNFPARLIGVLQSLDLYPSGESRDREQKSGE